LVEIKACEKFNRRHMVDIPRIQFFAQRRYLSAFGGSGKLVIYGWALSMVLSRGRMNRSIASIMKSTHHAAIRGAVLTPQSRTRFAIFCKYRGSLSIQRQSLVFPAACIWFIYP
jgi:hypothetical protein